MHEPIATINLAALTHNITRLKTYLADDIDMLVAVKADGYGHGAVQISKHLESIGVNWLGVATKGEALELRQGGVNGRILIFSPVYEGDEHELDAVVEAGIDFTVVDAHSIEVVSKAAARVSKRARVHLKVDTGMGRLGFLPDDAINVARQVDGNVNLEPIGVWTHFACADDADPAYTNMQLNHFHDMLGLLEQDNIDIPLKHTANSSALIAKPESHFDMVRPGIAAYGYHSSPFIAGLEPHLQPVMTVKAPVTFVKPFAAGRHISYSSLWQAPEDTTIATVRIGYADGYPRLLSNKGYVVTNDQTYPIRGRVCMDQLMIEVDSDDVQVGDAVTLFGDGLDAETLAGLYGSISYDLLVSVGKRVARDYIYQPLAEDVSATA
ncbi:MAG: alanine racemase [Deinococcota bacterium]